MVLALTDDPFDLIAACWGEGELLVAVVVVLLVDWLSTAKAQPRQLQQEMLCQPHREDNSAVSGIALVASPEVRIQHVVIIGLIVHALLPAIYALVHFEPSCLIQSKRISVRI